MTSLFQQKQRELLLAASRVEELSDQLEALRSSRMEPLRLPPPHHPQHAANAELECLYKELQVGQKFAKIASWFIYTYMMILQLRNKLNQDQSGRLQLQRDSLNKRNLEVAAMDRRLAELRQRLWKKKAALQQKESLPVSVCWKSMLTDHRATGTYTVPPVLFYWDPPGTLSLSGMLLCCPAGGLRWRLLPSWRRFQSGRSGSVHPE